MGGAVLLFCAVLSWSGTASADPNEEATKLNEDAIMNDYLTLNLDAAVSKLQKAIELCAGDACSKAVLAKVHRDLGVVYIAGMQKRDEALAAFIEALKVDPNVALDKDLSTPEAEQVFAEAKGQAGETPAPEEKPPAGPPPQSDEIEHTPPAEQAVLTPVPIHVSLPEGVSVGKVRVRYRPFGSNNWKSIELTKSARGYGGYIPCLDVGSATGDLSYYIEVLDDDDTAVANSGSEGEPHRVAIKNELSGESPHLPGKPAPAQCQDSADCPPEFPGCGGGEEEEEEEDLGDAVLNWLSVSFQADMLLMPSTDGACLSNASVPYECYYGDGRQRIVGANYDNQTRFADPGGIDPSTGKLVGAGNVGGGFALATMRALVGFDRVFLKNFTAGVRVGFAFNGGPTTDQTQGNKSFMPIHAELGVGYYFIPDTFARTGFRPFIRLGGGIAQVHAKLTSPILDMRVADQVNPPPPVPANGANPTIEIWKKSGMFFGSVSLGTMLAIGRNHGPTLELKGLILFPDSGMGVAGQLGYSVGF
ncbi:MAG TPA: tetratricopeptide repeat protein [Polyangiaceae bacterium]|nr:tetratricopeptide repeat protein [Polyangiaceae bacterium]